MYVRLGAKLVIFFKFCTMKVIDLLFLGRNLLKIMSKNDIKASDEFFVDIYDEFQQMRENGDKFSVAVMVLSMKYGVSERTISRAIKRLSKDVKR